MRLIKTSVLLLLGTLAIWAILAAFVPSAAETVAADGTTTMRWYHWAGIVWAGAIAVALLVTWGSGDTLKRQPLDKVERFD